MKTLFSLLNLVVGLLALAVGFGNLQALPHNFAGAGAGLIAIAMGAICLWLTGQSMSFHPRQYR